MKLAKNYLSGSKFISDLYGEDLSFDGVNLQEVSFGWNGPIAKLRFSMKDFPLVPPRKWEGLNAVQVELSAFPLSEVVLPKFGSGNKCDLTIEFFVEDSCFTVKISGDSEASFKALTVNVDKVSAYLRE
ncbi:MAG TPA: hypothetical protein DIW67_10275 [Pseudomonas sp.]|uniref:Imm50 family immunity protein n=1 Tax=Pseudomonas sp. TaxID=306 RepID=UPI000EEF4214|nr:Imm50 family immunity protein [Pseudomonas sp.]HCS07506.1 hypothetical protein [Pseudomonas sp.]